MDQEGRLVEAPGQLHAERPRSVFAIVFGDEAPALEQRHLPVQRALRQAGLFGQRRDAERPVMPGQRGQHIQDAIRAGADRGVGCQDSSPNELERRLSIYGFDPANYSRKLRITRENPSKYEKSIKGSPARGHGLPRRAPRARHTTQRKAKRRPKRRRMRRRVAAGRGAQRRKSGWRGPSVVAVQLDARDATDGRRTGLRCR